MSTATENSAACDALSSTKKPRNYKTYTRTYKQLCDGKLNTPLKDAVWRVVPTTMDMAKPMIAKALAAIAAAAALAVIAVKIF